MQKYILKSYVRKIAIGRHDRKKDSIIDKTPITKLLVLSVESIEIQL